MKKKILLSIIAFLMLFMVYGCGNDNGEENNNENGNNSEVENNNGNGTSDNGSSTSVSDEIKLYSDSNKMVFQVGTSQLVYYYSGDKITAYHAYVDYGDAVTANYALSVAKAEEDSNIKKAYTKGRYLVIEYNENEYENTTASEIKTAYAYFEQIQNK